MTIDRKHRDYLEDIAKEIRKVSYFIKEFSFEQFKADEKTVYAFIRAIEIIGEASKKVPDEINLNRAIVIPVDPFGITDEMA